MKRDETKIQKREKRLYVKSMRTSTRNKMKAEVTVQRRKKYSFSSSMKCQKNNREILFFQTISKTISDLRQGREGGLVIDIDGSSTILTTTITTSPRSSATSTRTTVPVSTIPSTIATASSTTFGSVETGLDFKVNLLLLFGPSLRSGLGLLGTRSAEGDSKKRKNDQLFRQSRRLPLHFFEEGWRLSRGLH